MKEKQKRFTQNSILGQNSIAEDSRPVSPPTADDPDKIRQNNNNQTDDDSAADDSSPPKNQGLIKARGTYFPLTAFPTSMPQGPVMRRAGTPPGTEQSPMGK